MADAGTTVHRITAAVHQQKHGKMIALLEDLKVGRVVMENGRSLRRLLTRKRFELRRQTARPAESAIHLYQFNSIPSCSEDVMRRIAESLELNRPGRGAIYAQEVVEYVADPDIAREIPEEPPPAPLRDLALIKCILPSGSGGPDISTLALEIGAGVPMVSLGHGTGLRDRLGLIRITISPDKEILRLLVPAADSEGIVRLLVEQGRLNRPGKGFIYCCPVKYGFMDTRLGIGFQEHSASIGQIIAAIDDLKKSTSWRQRFSGTEPGSPIRFQGDHSVMTLVCPEEHSGFYVETALENGAQGATMARLQHLGIGDSPGAAGERCIFVVGSSAEKRLTEKLLEEGQKRSDPPASLYTHPARFIYTYRR